jgi:hypothetical protein
MRASLRERAVALARNRSLLILAAILALGAAIRFGTLPARSFWVDEAYTVMGTRMDFVAMLEALPTGSPPVYNVLAWIWTGAFGHDEVGLRSLSALAGTATIPVAYSAARRLVDWRVGLVAALLTAVNPLAVWFSQDGRTYALLMLMGGLSFLAFLRVLERPGRGRLVAWVTVSALAVGCHYFAVFLVAAEAVWLAAVRVDLRRRLAWIFSALGALIALLLIALDPGGRESAPLLFTPSFPSRLVQIPAQYVVGFQPPAQVLVSVLAFLALPVAAWLLVTRADARERRAAWAAGFVGGAALLGPAAMALVPALDYLSTRYTVSAFVPLVCVVAIALGGVRAGRVGVGALTWLCAFSVMVDVVTANRPKFDHEDWRAAARALGPADGPRALVVTPWRGTRVLAIYVPGVHRPSRPSSAVGEIAVIGLPPSLRCIGQRPRPPRPASPPAPAGFELVQRREAPTFTLIRYRAGRDVRVTDAALESLALADADSRAVLVQNDPSP